MRNKYTNLQTDTKLNKHYLSEGKVESMKRKLNNKATFCTKIYIPILLVVALLITESCATWGIPKEELFQHSSEFKKSRRKSKTVTKPLFMQSEKVDIAFAQKDDFLEMYNIPVEQPEPQSIVLPEEDYLLEFVDIPGFTPVKKEEIAVDDSVASKTTEYLRSIPNVFNVLKQPNKRFVSERNGTVKLDFKVTVPSQLLSSKWRLIMNPELLQGDSSVVLPMLKITGEEFAAKQKLDDINYQKFLRSLVLRGDYGTVFSDRERTEKELKKLQEFYWNAYYKDWSKQVNYEKWKFDRQDQDAFYAAQRKGVDMKNYNENALVALNMVARDYAAGVDTIGLYDKYLNELQVEEKKYYTQGLENAELEDKVVPRRYRKAHAAGVEAGDIKNFSTTRLDSLRFASHLYDYDEVALNEVTVARINEIRGEIMKYPLDGGDSFILDSVIKTRDNDLVYHYSKIVPVAKGQESFSLAMNSKVEAVDLSTFRMAPTDTLTYYITNMNQLADSTLSAKKVRIFRNVYDLITIQPKYKVNSADFDVNFGDNKVQADSVYRTYMRNRYERGLTIDSVILKGSASLEGTYDKNLDLSRRRSVGMKEFLKGILPTEANVSETFVAKYIGEDWDGMKKEIEAHPDIKNKEQILEMLNTSVYPDQTEHDIRRKYKADYAIIMNDIYPKLRKIDIVFNMSRPSMGVADSIFSEVNEPYVHALENIKNGNFNAALETLEGYQDYNTALCYANLNEYEKAYDLLKKLEPNGYTEYLSAIVSYRVGRKQDAAKHLIDACKTDFRQAYRILGDDEVAAIVNEFKLQDQIKAILKEADAPVVPEVEVTDIEITEGPGGIEGVSKYNPENEERIGIRVNEDQKLVK